MKVVLMVAYVCGPISVHSVGKWLTYNQRVEKGAKGCPLVLVYYYLIYRGYVVAFEQGTENRIDTNHFFHLFDLSFIDGELSDCHCHSRMMVMVVHLPGPLHSHLQAVSAQITSEIQNLANSQSIIEGQITHCNVEL